METDFVETDERRFTSYLLPIGLLMLTVGVIGLVYTEASLMIAAAVYYLIGVAYGYGWMDRKLRERGYWKLTDSPKKFLAQLVFGFIWLPYLIYRYLGNGKDSENDSVRVDFFDSDVLEKAIKQLDWTFPVECLICGEELQMKDIAALVPNDGVSPICEKPSCYVGGIYQTEKER